MLASNNAQQNQPYLCFIITQSPSLLQHHLMTFYVCTLTKTSSDPSKHI